MGLLALTAVFFAIEHLLGGGMEVLVHLRLGALRADRVAEHNEYFRLLMPLFLHHGLIHLLFNGFALLQLGALVEHFWGSRRLLAYYVVCGLGASLVSAVLNTDMARFRRGQRSHSGSRWTRAGNLVVRRFTDS